MDIQDFEEAMLNGQTMYTARELDKEVIIEEFNLKGYENYTEYNEYYNEEIGEFVKEEWEDEYPVFINDNGDTFVIGDFDELREGFGSTKDEAMADMYLKKSRPII